MTAIIHRELYPPSPHRKPPEWSAHLVLYLRSDEMWIFSLLKDIYSAAGMQAYSLVAMDAPCQQQ
jgi:hypothetical protein